MIKRTPFTLLGILFILPFIASSCKKDKTAEIDITLSAWDLHAVTLDGNKIKLDNVIPTDLSPDDYQLKFKNDTVFALNNRVNVAGGQYKIETQGQIIIITYKEFSKVASADHQEREFIQNLLTVFREVTTYKVIGKTLTFQGAKGEVKFKKE